MAAAASPSPRGLSDEELSQRLDRWAGRLQNLPSIALPTDYPRPSSSQLVQSFTSTHLSSKTRTALVRLALHADEDAEDNEKEEEEEDDDDAGYITRGQHHQSHTKADAPTAFHLLLAAFAVLVHRYTGDTDLVIGSSSPYTGEPLILRIPIEPGDPFWQIVRRIQAVEAEGTADSVPYERIVERLEQQRRQAQQHAGTGPSAPIFRVRVFDETGSRQGSFLQTTSLTSDLTLFVTRPGIKLDNDGQSLEHSMIASESSASTFKHGDAASPLASAFPATSALRDSLIPDISLHLSYNALLFSSSRMQTLLSQLIHIVNSAALNPSAAVGSIGLRTLAEAKALPDPQKDLDWCGWQGSITSIFERNARAHPHRTCLVESLSAPAGAASASIELPAPAYLTRTVTYSQLDRASNVLAHHLLQGGVQREEVVTVYAHRGVDLVVAVLGTLKAGATFSVIDPAYPPSRQNIYLQVARPRALVVLAKAGKLAASVRKCIEEELQIRVEVPALELLDDGSLRGGKGAEGSGNADADVLASAQAKAEESTNVLLGPDSIGTLSFTSGSTGTPKGVRGRHHSLTHFFPWMGERFGLGAQDRFTMLSGIAHDPIQRDIFTPLFFGAELHIPTAEDIGTPGRLAEWMAASRASVTHLTPAMGQLLSAQAIAQIPSLRNAFFVGDVLTKRDCTRLQALAANVRIVNMYGTTETQRAVSYFAIPPISSDRTFLHSQKDIMPAGQGMVDVQLLVVNRHDRSVTCGVGEVGEIYVRSGGLAEGYLGPPEVSAEKFMPNFLAAPDLRFEDTLACKPEAMFWKGIRDRMYRTGDLGRYLPDGTVECTGRADDQVKIRGFRIELGEIDTHLSRHPHVRENVTLVRRDKDEEKVLVSYFVPGPGAAELEELSSAVEDVQASLDASSEGRMVAGASKEVILARGMRKHRHLIKDIRDHLKKKLPSYSVPTLFVPLAKMPLNPNGKVDKPALPFPDTALANAAFTAPSKRADGSSTGGVTNSGSGAYGAVGGRQPTRTEQIILHLWSQLLPNAPQPLPLDESFFDLGGHSILATKLVFEMRKQFVVNVPLGVVFESPTAEGLAAAIESLKAADLNLGEGRADAKAELSSSSAPPSNAAQLADSDDYASDVDRIAAELPESFVSTLSQPADGKATVLLTGATGFLGAFILRDLLTARTAQVGHVIAHVRAKDAATGLNRLREGGVARGAWDEQWVQQGKLSVAVGDLAKVNLGLQPTEWADLANRVDAVIHNGALVHWVYPYSRLRAANVLSTVACILLAASGRPKTFTFVSSTSALDTEHYVELSDSLSSRTDTKLSGVPESDDLMGSAKGLKTGYGQSKWIGEKVTMLAASRGLRAAIVRPGYVVGDSKSAVNNTDDFLFRLVKGCTQLGLVPDMHNTVNMVPVDHVARITVLASLQTLRGDGEPHATTFAPVYHVTGHPTVRFNDLLQGLVKYGWAVTTTDYVQWRARLEEHVLQSGAAGKADNALFPLLHFVLDDLPTSTKAPDLDDMQTQALLTQAKEGADQGVVMGVDSNLIGLYFAWFVAVGFLEAPTAAPGQNAFPLPSVVSAGLKALGRGSSN